VATNDQLKLNEQESEELLLSPETPSNLAFLPPTQRQGATKRRLPTLQHVPLMKLNKIVYDIILL